MRINVAVYLVVAFDCANTVVPSTLRTVDCQINNDEQSHFKNVFAPLCHFFPLNRMAFGFFKLIN